MLEVIAWLGEKMRARQRQNHAQHLNKLVRLHMVRKEKGTRARLQNRMPSVVPGALFASPRCAAQPVNVLRAVRRHADLEHKANVGVVKACRGEEKRGKRKIETGRGENMAEFEGGSRESSAAGFWAACDHSHLAR